MARAEGKPIRKVREHFRKTSKGRIIVNPYLQRYDQPRGNWSRELARDNYKPKSKTAWIKDSTGRFIGRMNSKGQTAANKRRISTGGYDKTTNYRERGRYGRIKGRVEQ